jgi:ATP-binding cassette subfamily C protein LapB
LRESEIMEACEQTKLSVLIASHPRGLDLEIAEGGQGLSVGQRQLVALTRLLLAKPKVAFLDEPTSAMDSALDRHIIELLFGKVLERTTVILVTHKMGDLKYVDRVTVMNAGRMVLDGPRDDVIARLTSDTDGGNNDL